MYTQVHACNMYMFYVNMCAYKNTRTHTTHAHLLDARGRRLDFVLQQRQAAPAVAHAGVVEGGEACGVFV